MAFQAPVVLKARHSLIGRSLIPVIIRLKAWDGEDVNFARLKKEYPLEDYSIVELRMEFERLTGESAKDVLTLAGREEDLEGHVMRLLVHFAIEHANSVGAPKGQTLGEAVPIGTGMAAGTAASSGVGGVASSTLAKQGSSGTGGMASSSNSNTGTPVSGGGKETKSAGVGSMEEQLRSMRTDLEALKSRRDGLQDESYKKMQKFVPDVPEWELKSGFDPLSAIQRLRRKTKWVNVRGETTMPSSRVEEAEAVAVGKVFCMDDIIFRDPKYFRAGSLHCYLSEWNKLNPPEEVRDWLENCVRVEPMFRQFKGNFKGKSYDSEFPESNYFPNAKICEDHVSFIVRTLGERIEDGSMSVIGKVGECDPPYLVLPITIEPSKPRMCHDERYLNLWICDFPFTLDTLKDVPRMVGKDSFMSSIDDKSGYNHILLHPDSRKYFGLQFGGWYLVFNTIPFGFKPSAYIYHTTGYVPVSYCRELGVPVLLYIDDRLIGECQQKGDFHGGEGQVAALRGLFVVCQVMVRLGYYLNLEKCNLTPSRSLKYLGMICDSEKLAFCLPSDKKASFCTLRDFILASESVQLKTLQRFAGKCISLVLAVPAARLYSREANRAISIASRNSKPVRMYRELKTEVGHWNFLDSWEGFVPWRNEQHLQVVLATDSSSFKWGAFVLVQGKMEEFGDLWDSGDQRPIHIKEADALLNALLSVREQVANHRVDVYCDNQAVVFAWNNQGARDSKLTATIKAIFEFTVQENIDLRVHFVPSAENPADAESRRLSELESKLSPEKWSMVDSLFGPHTVDLMAIDSNVMLDRVGNPLRHFTPFPSVGSSGVNVFSQDLSVERNPYVFPPFNLIFPLLKFFEESKLRGVTMVLPNFDPRPIWWPFFQSRLVDSKILCQKGEDWSSTVAGPDHDNLRDKGPQLAKDYLVQRRLSYLDNLVGNTSYSRQKSVLEKDFILYLRDECKGKDITSVSPEDIRRFLVFRDAKGKTQVHAINCPFVGKYGKFDCGCPTRLASGTVQSLIGKLKSIFELYGRGLHWDEFNGFGNPVCSSAVSRYLKAVQMEQAKSHVMVKQAKPLFPRKLKLIASHIDNQLKGGKLSLSRRFTLLRDQAFFKIQFFSGDRANDLGLCLAQEVKVFPDNEKILFRHTVGKTLGSGKVNEFIVPRVEDNILCPVQAFHLYVEGARQIGIDLSAGYLFRTLDSSKSVVTSSPVSSSVMFDRLKSYLKLLGIDEGETPHGIRGACAISLAVKGATTGDVMNHVGWASDSTYKRYSRVGQMVGSNSVGAMMAVVAGDDSSEVVFQKLVGK